MRYPARQHGIPPGQTKRHWPVRPTGNVISLSAAARSVRNGRVLSTIETELVRLRVAVRTGGHWPAAAAREALVAVTPHGMGLVEMASADPRLTRRVQALFAFVDALAESPRSLRATHLEALRCAGFDTDATAALTRLVAAAIYESSFTAIRDEDRCGF